MIDIRLWHQKLIPHLPRQQLLGQHRECCALRGAGWGRNHSVVNYVFTHNTARLVAYHFLVMNEMKKRGYKPDETWYDPDYRGSTLGRQTFWCQQDVLIGLVHAGMNCDYIIYPEHNDEYLQECLDNLKGKGICIDLN